MRRRILMVVLSMCLVCGLMPSMAWAGTITVKDLAGQTFTIEAEKGDSIDNVKAKILGAKGIATDKQTLIYAGQRLEDGRTLADYGVTSTNGLTLHLLQTAWTDVDNASGLTTPLSSDTTPIAIRLTADITLDSSLEIKKTVILDLNGHVLSLKQGSTGSVIEVKDSGNLTIIDSRAGDSEATHKFKVNGDGLWELVDSAANENEVAYQTITGGVITGGNSPDYGGGIYVETASLTMTGGSIVGCKANTDNFSESRGGGLGIDNKAGEDMSGAYTANIVLENINIIGCSAYSGGGLYVGGWRKDAKTNISMKDVNISSCSANSHSCAEIGSGCTQLDIQSGIFNGKVTNLGVISGGTFNDEVENSSTGPAWIGTIYTSKITLGSGAKITTTNGCNTVTYCSDGSEYARQAVKSGDKTSALTIKPEKTGYTFDEWYTEDGSTFDFANKKVAANLSLDAKWNECKEHEYNDNNICTKCGYRKITYSGSSTQHPTVAETTNGTITLSSSCI